MAGFCSHPSDVYLQGALTAFKPASTQMTAHAQKFVGGFEIGNVGLTPKGPKTHFSATCSAAEDAFDCGFAAPRPLMNFYALTARSPDNRAVSVISAFSNREMGQPAFASCAAFSNAALSAPGIFAVTSRWTFVIVKPASSFSSVTAAVVSRLSGVMPAFPSCAESAIVKQPACAAAINSSGFVPAPFSNRVENEYCVFERTPLSVEIVPLPSFNEPFQTAEALRTIFFIPPQRLDVPARQAATSPRQSLARETCAAKSETNGRFSKRSVVFSSPGCQSAAADSSGLADMSQVRDKSVLRCQVAASIRVAV